MTIQITWPKGLAGIFAVLGAVILLAAAGTFAFYQASSEARPLLAIAGVILLAAAVILFLVPREITAWIVLVGTAIILLLLFVINSQRQPPPVALVPTTTPSSTPLPQPTSSPTRLSAPTVPPSSQPTEPPAPRLAPTATLPTPTMQPQPSSTPPPSPSPLPPAPRVPRPSGDYANVGQNHEGRVETRSLSLTEGEAVVGTADRFQDVAYQTQPLPPFTAFLIRGPVKLNVSMWWGGWDKYVDVTEDNAAFMVAKLQEKVDTIYRDHPDDYAIRGVRACRIIGPNERQSCDVIVPARR